MGSRPNLQKLLENLIGNNNVYFQPPPSVQMSYPAIVYSRTNIKNKHANNAVYNQYIAYQLIVIDKNPDSEITQKVSNLPLCAHNRSYKSDNLNHDVFTIYY